MRSAKVEDHARGRIVLRHLAVNAHGQTQRLVEIDACRHPGSEAAGGVEVLALGDVEAAVPQPVADGAFIAQRETDDVVVRARLGDAPPEAADHQRDLAFVVELHGFRRPHDRLVVPDQRIRRAEEHARDISRFPCRR